MEPTQLAGMARRKWREACLPRLPVDIASCYDPDPPGSLSVSLSSITTDTDRIREQLSDRTRAQLRDRSRQATEGELTFLDRTVELDDPLDIDWFDPRFDRFPLLWSLKCYAFEPLRWAVLGYEDPVAAPDALTRTFDAWVCDWTETAEIGRSGYLRSTWTPWTVSLRIQTLARYLAWRRRGDSVDDEADAVADLTETLAREIYRNARFLSDHVEHGVGGNHLVENGAALFTAGVVFPKADHDWRSAGRSILGRAGATQFLADGGHFERSPMYHAMVTERFVTACSLAGASDESAPAWLREMTRRAVGFLAYLHPPDGRIPLFNDAVFGQNLPIDACLGYASAVGVDPDEERTPRARRQGATESGYYWLDTETGRLLVDGGPVGPPHLPGHSHNDTLSFVLWAGDQRVITDTGVYDYESNERRQRARGVRGHNTVQVGDHEPIEIGGRYLMGARTDPSVRYTPGDPTVFDGVYETARGAPASYQHRRTIVADDEWWLVRDRVAGPAATSESVTSRLHFHPDVSVGLAGDNVLTVSDADSGPSASAGSSSPESALLSVRPVGTDALTVTDTEYYPRYGVAQARDTLELQADGDDGPVEFGYLLAPSRSVAADVSIAAVTDRAVPRVSDD